MTGSSEKLPPRLNALRAKLLGQIPAMSGSQQKLSALTLSQAMDVYIAWASRFIKPRRRVVAYAPGFWRNEAAIERGGDLLSLEAVVRAGGDLTPYLSSRVFTDGYSAPRQANNRKKLDWSGKDFALNAYGIHHLHFIPSSGKTRGAEPGRHGHLLYVDFQRHEATFLMVGDHKSFDDGTLHNAVIEARATSGAWELRGIRPSRNPDDHKDQFRLARHGLTTTDVRDGRVFVGAFLGGAGNSPHNTRHADRIMLTLADAEPRLDLGTFQQQLFAQAGRPAPNAPIFEWHVEYTELSVIEHTSQIKFIMVDGRN